MCLTSSRGPAVWFALSSLLLAILVHTALGAEPAGREPWRSKPVYGYRIVHAYPHDCRASTQGLVFIDGFLYEGTGLNGGSTLRKVRLETGEVLQQKGLPSQYFGEGITDWGAGLLQLTWKSNTGFVYDRSTFRLTRTFHYDGEGWGLTHDGNRVIMSDGSASLCLLDPQTLQKTGRLIVRDGETPVLNLNELEYVRGEVYANVWKTSRIARISLRTGQVTGWIDLRGLLKDMDKAASIDALNGIAYDSQGDRLFVTGKLWPKLFEIKVVPAN